MRLILTNDLHQWMQKWPQLVTEVQRSKPDFVLIAGDLLPKDSFEDQRAFLKKTLRRMLGTMRQAGSNVLLYFGNDDVHTLEPELDKIASEGLCVNLNGRIHRESGLVFVGMPWVRDHPFGYKHWCVPDDDFITNRLQFTAPMTYDDKGEKVYILPQLFEGYVRGKPSIRQRLETLKSQLQPGEMERSVWMVHQPPAKWGMDLCASGEQVGSLALTNFIEVNKPLLGLSGHIHESPTQPGGSWYHLMGGCTWFQPGQTGTILHYVDVELGDPLKFSHRVYGAPK